MSIYADKKPKPSSKNSRKKSSSSIYYDLPSITSQKPFWLENNKTLKDGTDSKSSDDIMKYLLEKYREIVHYNSPEPERYGVRAFTKNSEIYIAPGGESALPHELAHVYQQKTQNIPATGEINGEKVNTDPKLEKEADKISKNIGGYIPRVIISGKKQANPNNVMQFAPPSKKTYQLIKRISKNIGSYVSKVIISGKKQDAANDIVQFVPPSKETYQLIKRISKDCGIPDSVMTDEKVNDIFRKYEENLDNYLFHREYRDCPECLLLDEIKNDPECQLYLNLNSSRPQWTNFNEGENQRILGITDMLARKKIFFTGRTIYRSSKKICCTFRQAMGLLSEEQKGKVSKNILRLKDCCDAEGIKSVLQSANTNVMPSNVILDFEEKDIETKKNQTASFVKRLELMTRYIESVYKKFDEKYWVRSTGSDPHQAGQHALFLINKVTKDIEKVYKPHNMRADAMISGKNGMFAESNALIKDAFITKCRELGLNIGENSNVLATMDIDAMDHTEEFIKKKGEMTPDEAKVYFFRSGILKVITDAMAVIDLHADNIMPTEKGPMIIDAEIDFFHYGENSLLDAVSAGALTTDKINDNPTNSTFIIKGGKDGRDIRSGEAFRDESSQYYKMYIEGYNFMLNKMKEKSKEDFKKMFREQLEDVHKVRILPLATQTFAYALQAVMIGKRSKDALVCDLTDDIEDNLTSKAAKFLNSKYIKINISDKKLKIALKETFKNRTIPAMYAGMDGKIYLDDVVVGRILKKDDEKVRAFDSDDELRDIIKECFIEMIESMPYFKKEAK